jgi:hypothetical protein
MTTPINLTQLRTIVESAKGADPGIGPREVLALIDTAEAAIEATEHSYETTYYDEYAEYQQRLRETLNHYTTTP